MKQYVFTILITWLITYSITYALSQETTQEKLERENKAILETYAKEQRDCYDNATGSSIEISQKYDLCKLRPKPQLKTISWDWNSWSSGEVIEVNWTHSTGSTVPPQWQEAVEIAKKKFAHAKLYQDVCKKQINSPLCKDRELFDRLYQLTEERIPNKNWFAIQLWILNSESSLGTNFYPSKCDYTNNLAWKKWRKTDSWESVRDQKIPDANWCWLYSFKSIEDFWISYTNTFKYWYAWCIDSKTPLSCIAPMYVKWDWKPKPQWVKNASIFLD